MAKKKFIQSAIERPGDLTRKAKNEGQTVSEFCADIGPGADPRTKRQCALAKTLNKVRPRRRGR